jgi:hypothetical protein
MHPLLESAQPSAGEAAGVLAELTFACLWQLLHQLCSVLPICLLASAPTSVPIQLPCPAQLLLAVTHTAVVAGSTGSVRVSAAFCCCCCCCCRCVAALAESSHPELELLVLPDMLRSAMLSAVQVCLKSVPGLVCCLLASVLVGGLCALKWCCQTCCTAHRCHQCRCVDMQPLRA